MVKKPNYNKKAQPKSPEELKHYLREPYKRIECENMVVKLKDIDNETKELLKKNEHLLWLSLDEQMIKDVTRIAEALAENTVLQELFLNGNKIQDVNPLAEALKKNSALKTLSLGENYISDVEALAEAIKVNTTLKELDLFENRITDTGANRLIEALKVNASIKNATIQKNKMSKSKYQEFNKAIVTKPANAKRQYSAKTILESMEASVSEQV